MKKDQYEYLEEIQSFGYNIVTCADCGAVIIVKTEETLHKCAVCGFESEPCDFSDLFYPGWARSKFEKSKFVKKSELEDFEKKAYRAVLVLRELYTWNKHALETVRHDLQNYMDYHHLTILEEDVEQLDKHLAEYFISPEDEKNIREVMKPEEQRIRKAEEEERDYKMEHYYDPEAAYEHKNRYRRNDED